MNPNFHSRERYDCALISSGGGFVICRLLGVFEVRHEGDQTELALVLPFDEQVVGLTAHERKRDSDLRFTRVRSRKLEDSALIPVESIVRGALVVPDNSSTSGRDYIVMDVVDADFWLRMRVDKLGTALKFNARL